MSRHRSLSVLAAIAAALVLAAGLVACGDGDGGGGGGDPQTVIDDATLKGIESGVLDFSLAVTAEGREGGDLDAGLSGPFDAATDSGEKPRFDLSADLSSSFGDDATDFEGGLVLLPNSAYVDYEGTDYEVDPTTFSFVEAALKEAQQQNGGEESGAGGVDACREAFAQLEVGDFVDGLSDDGDADVGGTSTTKVSGDLDVGAAIDALLEVAEDPGCSSQIGGSGVLPPQSVIDEAKREVEGAVKRAHIDIYVGEDDIVRRISAQLAIEPQGGGDDGVRRLDIDFELQLTEVNEEQEIAAPGGAKPLSDLFVKLGINPIELLGLLRGEGGAGLGDLLEGLSGAASGGSGTSQQEYLECLQNVRSAADLQKCARLR